MGVSAPPGQARRPFRHIGRIVFYAIAAFVIVGLFPLAFSRNASSPERVRATGACLPDGSAYRKKIDSAMGEFVDAMKVAEVSPRITLGGRVERLQQVKRDFEAAPSPACASPARAALLYAMTLQIDAYLAFMSADSQDEKALRGVVAARGRALEAWQGSVIELAKVMGNPVAQ